MVDDTAVPGEGDRWYALSVRRTSPASQAIEAIAVLSDITRLKAHQREPEELRARPRVDVQPVRNGIAFVCDGRRSGQRGVRVTLTGYPAEDVAESAAALFADRSEYNPPVGLR